MRRPALLSFRQLLLAAFILVGGLLGGTALRALDHFNTRNVLDTSLPSICTSVFISFRG